MLNLKFSYLFSVAISEWPKTLDLKLIEETEDLQRYAVEELGLLTDSISDVYINHAQEIIYRNLHWSINVVIHRVAKYTTNIELTLLRPKAVQIQFESILIDILKDDYDWIGQKCLIEEYFRQNFNDYVNNFEEGR